MQKHSGGFFRTFFGNKFPLRKAGPPAIPSVSRSSGSFANQVRRDAPEAAAQLPSRAPSSPALLNPRAPPPQPSVARGRVPSPGPAPAPRAQPSNAPAGPSRAAAAAAAGSPSGRPDARVSLEEAEAMLEAFMRESAPAGRTFAPLLSRSGRTIAEAPEGGTTTTRCQKGEQEADQDGDQDGFTDAREHFEESSPGGAGSAAGGRRPLAETRAFGSDISAATSPSGPGSSPGSAWSSRPGSANPQPAEGAGGADGGEERAGESSNGVSNEGRSPPSAGGSLRGLIKQRNPSGLKPYSKSLKLYGAGSVVQGTAHSAQVGH